MRSLLLAALLLTANPVYAGPPDMLLPYAVETGYPNGWRHLYYTPPTFRAGEVRLVMFCLRAGDPIAGAPMVHVLPEGDTPRRDKVALLVSYEGASPVPTADLPPYVTYRIENTTDADLTAEIQLWVRRIE